VVLQSLGEEGEGERGGWQPTKGNRRGGGCNQWGIGEGAARVLGGGRRELPTAGSQSTAQNHTYARVPDPRAHQT
jgi:hypothetical protein